MNPSIYSIISTFITFVILMIYYNVVKPDFVLKKDSETKKVCLRLCLVYSLLFSSAIGLLVLGVSSIAQNYNTN